MDFYLLPIQLRFNIRLQIYGVKNMKDLSFGMMRLLKLNGL